MLEPRAGKRLDALMPMENGLDPDCAAPIAIRAPNLRSEVRVECGPTSGSPGDRSTPRPGFYARHGKRAFDIVTALLLMPTAVPLVAIASLGVWVALGRPVLFPSSRIGRGGDSFTMLKLRSMALGDGADEARIGHFGRLLRASAIDELPQLWHVLRGEMSLVGPRPLPSHYAPVLPIARHAVRPGITGLAQVAGRNALAWPERLQLDRRYTESPTLIGDIRILWATLRLLLARRGTAPGPRPPSI